MATHAKSLAELTLLDFERAKGLVKKIHPDPIDPQFRLGTPEGDIWLAVTLPPDVKERLRIFGIVSDFMAMQSAYVFTLASELHEPDSVYCLGCSMQETVGVIGLIRRKPFAFAKWQWMHRDHIGDEVPSLLPRGSRSLSSERLIEVDEWFGPTGKFPAVRLNHDGTIPR